MPKFTAIMQRSVLEQYTTTVFAKDVLEAEEIIQDKYPTAFSDWKQSGLSHKWERAEPSYSDWNITQSDPEKIEIGIREIEDSKFTPSVVIGGVEWVQVDTEDSETVWKKRGSFVSLSDTYVSYDSDASARFAACEYVMDQENPNWWKRYAS